jgi:NitT/TauT family transport system permease protein
MVGVFPTVALSTYLFAKDVPHELIESALSRGASQFEIVYRIVLPVIWPKVLDSIRLSFMAGIQCLLAGEFMIASQGLGYRIYLMKRTIQMDMIIPYVLWMTLLIFIADRLVALWISKKYEWAKR